MDSASLHHGTSVADHPRESYFGFRSGGGVEADEAR